MKYYIFIDIISCLFFFKLPKRTTPRMIQRWWAQIKTSRWCSGVKICISNFYCVIKRIWSLHQSFSVRIGHASSDFVNSDHFDGLVKWYDNSFLLWWVWKIGHWKLTHVPSSGRQCWGFLWLADHTVGSTEYFRCWSPQSLSRVCHVESDVESGADARRPPWYSGRYRSEYQIACSKDALQSSSFFGLMSTFLSSGVPFHAFSLLLDLASLKCHEMSFSSETVRLNECSFSDDQPHLPPSLLYDWRLRHHLTRGFWCR